MDCQICLWSTCRALCQMPCLSLCQNLCQNLCQILCQILCFRPWRSLPRIPLRQAASTTHLTRSVLTRVHPHQAALSGETRLGETSPEGELLRPPSQQFTRRLTLCSTSAAVNGEGILDSTGPDIVESARRKSKPVQTQLAPQQTVVTLSWFLS